jgi:hypothetical protein
MANRSNHPVSTPKSECHLLTAILVGGGAAQDMTTPETDGEVVTAVYAAATGVYTIAFRHLYPELKSVLGVQVVGTTDGLRGQFLEIDVAAGTATLEMYVGSTKTDVALTDTVYINLLVRNSGRNHNRTDM